MAMRQVSGRGPRQAGKARAALFGSVSLMALVVTGGEAVAQQVYANGDDNAAGIDLNDAATRRTFSVPTGAATQSGAITESVAGSGLEKIGAGTLTISNGANSYTGGTLISSGTVIANQAGALGTGAITLNGGTLRSTSTFTLANDIITGTSGTATITAANGQNLTLGGFLAIGPVTFAIGSATDNGTVTLGLTGSAGIDSASLLVAGGTLAVGNLTGAVLLSSFGTTTIHSGARLNYDSTLGIDLTITNLQGGGTLTNNGVTRIVGGNFAGVIEGTGGIDKLTNGTLILTGANTYSGITTISAGTLQIGNGGTTGTLGTGNVVNNRALVFNRSNMQTVANVISGTGTLTQAGTGATILTGTSTYTGATIVDAGTLSVNGSIAQSSSVTVNGGLLGGNGQVPTVLVNTGGSIGAGNSVGTLTVNGNLTLAAGSTTIAEVQGAVSDRINVTGTAALAGTLRIVPLGGAYLFGTPYTLLSAQGGRNGSFGSVDTTGSFGDGVTTGVAYTATDVQLTLTPKPLAPVVADPAPIAAVAAAPVSLGLGSGQGTNAYAVARGIDRAVAGGADPSPLFAIYNLPAAAIPAAVNQLSGEAHTAAPAMANSAAGQFLHTMLDATGAGRLAGASGGPAGAAGFTADLPSRQDGPGRARFDPARFSLWGATFGSTGRTDGDAVAGSASRNLSDAYVAVGADVRLGSNTVAGLAVAGGQSQASLSGGLGKAKADVLQAGLYGRTTLGAVNLAAALGYGRLDTETHRAIPALGRTGVTASYATQAWSGRIEASLPVMSRSGVTLSPLAAFQAVMASSPGAVERDATGAGAGMLTLARRSDITSRSELGLQLDANLIAGAAPVTGFVRASWAHYYQRDAELTSSINGLAGATFNVTGARPGRNTALFSAGADIKLSSSVSMGMRVDTEFAENTHRFGGKAQLKVSF